MRKYLLAGVFLLCAGPAFAVCPSPLTGKDAAGTTQNFGVTVDGSGNCYGNVAIVDGTNASVKATVDSSGVHVVATGIAKDTSYTNQTGSIGMGLVNTSPPTGGSDATLGFISLTGARAQRIDIYSQNGAAVTAEPCQTNAHSFAVISLSGTSGLYTTPIQAGTSAKNIYVCHLIINNNAALGIALFEATHATSCGTGATGMWGGTTAATGFQLAANSGVALGNGGHAIAHTATNQDDICAITNSTTQITGRLEYVVQ